MEAREKLLNLLAKSGAQLLRHKRHPRYRLKNGHKVTIPNDNDSSKSWESAYTRLRGRLEPVAERIKIRTEEQQRPKESYVPKHQPKQEFLSGLEPTHAIAQAPAQPVLRELPKAFEVNSNSPKAGERVQTSWGVQAHGTGSIKIGQRPSARSGGGTVFSPEIIAEANRLRVAYGEEESRKYLDSIHNKLQYTAPPVIKPEKKEGIQMAVTNVGGTIEETLNRTKSTHQQLLRQKEEALKQVSMIDLEIMRALKIIEGLEQVVKVGLMTLADFQVSTNGNGNGHSVTTRRKGRWKPLVKMAIESSPVPLTRSDLKAELKKAAPDASAGAVYQGMLKLFEEGYLVEENRGDCHAVYINETQHADAG